MTAFLDLIMRFTNWMWSWPVLVILIGGGIYLTIVCDFIQIKHFAFAMKKTFGCLFAKRDDKSKISGRQTAVACLANTIGTGNIVGVGSAIALGGPGAVFWMWVIGFVAMCLKYCEAVLAVHTRVKDTDGMWRGGAPIYLSHAWKPLGVIWGVCLIFAMSIGGAAHTGSVATAAAELGVPTMVATVLVCIAVVIVVFGGLRTLIKITDKMVPFMTIMYVGTGLIVILLHVENVLPVFASIFKGAFTGASATGGFVGATLAATIKNGCARGVYSSDAGNGSASLMHAQAEVDHPVEQGFWGVFEVFVDTIIVCTFTALTILCTGVWETGDPGSVLAINAFSTLGEVGHIIASCGLLLFALSSVIAITSMIGIAAKDLVGTWLMRLAQGVFVVGCFIGGTHGIDAVLPWVDFSNMIVVTLNVLGTVMLSKTLRELTLGYFANKH